jgi:hypothetical protein
MKLTSVSLLAEGIGKDTVSLARRHAALPSPETFGTDYRSSDGYILRRNYSATRAKVSVLDVPGKIMALDAIGIESEYGPLSTLIGSIPAGERFPWGKGYPPETPERPPPALPLAEGGTPPEMDIAGRRTFSFGETPFIRGVQLSSQVLADQSNQEYINPVVDDRLRITHPPLMRHGGGEAPGAGFWTCQLMADRALDLNALSEFPEYEPDTLHWMSIVSGYGNSGSLLEIRLAPEFIDSIAPGYKFVPDAIGSRRSFGGLVALPEQGTYPQGSACRRKVRGGTDSLTVALSVAKTNPNTPRKFRDCGLSGLLVMLFEIRPPTVDPFFAGGPALIAYHLYGVQTAHPDMRLQSYKEAYAPGEPDPEEEKTYLTNNVQMTSVVIAEDATISVFGYWLTTLVRTFTPDFPTAPNPNMVDERSPILLGHWFVATGELVEGAFEWGFERTRLVSHQYSNYGAGGTAVPPIPVAPLAGAPYIPAPMRVYAMIGAVNKTGPDGGATTEEKAGAVAVCYQMDRWDVETPTVNGATTGSGPVGFYYTFRPYGADPVVVYTFGADTYTSLPSLYQAAPELVKARPGYRESTRSIASQTCNAAPFDTQSLILVGWGRTPQPDATVIKSVTVGIFTGDIVEDPLPPITTAGFEYATKVIISTYQQKLFIDPDRTGVAAGYQGTISYVLATPTGTNTYGHVYRGYPRDAPEWEEIPSIAGHSGQHYVGSGLFGVPLRKFQKDGF